MDYLLFRRNVCMAKKVNETVKGYHPHAVPVIQKLNKNRLIE